MTKKKTVSSKSKKEEKIKSYKSKSADRDVFSLHNGCKRRKISKKEMVKMKECHESTDEEEDHMTEIRKISTQTLNARKKLLAVKNIKRQGRVSYETLVAGTVVGCRVSCVYTDRVVVCLPYKMRGYIPLTHISDHYTKLMHQVAAGESTTETALTLPQLYRPGQWLTAAVANSTLNSNKLLARKGLLLSVYPSDVNSSMVNCSEVRVGVVLQCAVISVEDHGYTLDSGIRGVTAAFLPSKELPEENEVGVGSVVTCVVSTVGGSKDTMTLSLSALPTKVKAAVDKVSPSSGVIMPGMTLQGVVTVSVATSLTLHLGTEDEYYDLLESENTDLLWNVGLVSRHHLRSSFDQCHVFRAGQKLTTKVLFSTNFPRTVYLTLNKDFFNYNPAVAFDPLHGIKLNTITTGIVFASSDEGVVLKLENNSIGFCFGHLAVGKDRKFTTMDLMEKFPIGKKMPCKPVAFNCVDNMFIVVFNTNRDRDIAEAAAAMTVGDVTSVTIIEHVECGVKVCTKSGVPSFIFKMHLPSPHMDDPERNYPIDSIVKAKVIKITKNESDEAVNKISVYFTLKTKLVQGSRPLISEFTEEAIGKKTFGVINNVQPKRMYLELCSNISALLNSVSFPPNTILTDHYKYGQVLQIKITGLCRPGKHSNQIFTATLPDFDPAVSRKVCSEKWFTNMKKTLGLSGMGDTDDKKLDKTKSSVLSGPTKKTSSSKARSSIETPTLDKKSSTTTMDQPSSKIHLKKIKSK